MRRVRVTIVAVKNAESITYCDRVFVALVIQHGMRMRHVVSCACPDVRYFSALPPKRHD
jgi:hypothetical protein